MHKGKISALQKHRQTTRYIHIKHTLRWLSVGGMGEERGQKRNLKSSDTLTFSCLMHLLAPSLKIPFSVIFSVFLPKDLSPHLSFPFRTAPLKPCLTSPR